MADDVNTVHTWLQGTLLPDATQRQAAEEALEAAAAAPAHVVCLFRLCADPAVPAARVPPGGGGAHEEPDHEAVGGAERPPARRPRLGQRRGPGAAARRSRQGGGAREPARGDDLRAVGDPRAARSLPAAHRRRRLPRALAELAARRRRQPAAAGGAAALRRARRAARPLPRLRVQARGRATAAVARRALHATRAPLGAIFSPRRRSSAGSTSSNKPSR